MIRKFLFILFFQIISMQAYSQMSYSIDPLKSSDTFNIKLELPTKINKKHPTFQFAATAPGTYQTMNIGRLVTGFKAYDKRGKELSTTFIPPNQYKINKVQKAKKIEYKVAETFDTNLGDMPIYMMAGSSIKDDHVLINPHTMLGYFEGLQNMPFRVTLNIKPEWQQASAMKQLGNNYYADNYDHLVDSPILAGMLTMASTTVAQTPVKVYCYSESGRINAELLLKQMSGMLNSAEKFLIKLPVDNYTFLYDFIKKPDGVTGAWEHSYSSEYVLEDSEPTEENIKKVADIASHEFFHIVTPLNIHSEIIENFNFAKPTPSQHLWLYEGTTEWASHIQLYRGGVTNLDDYISTALTQKILVNELYFDPSWSLKKIAMESFNGGDGAKQYGNIYYKGALASSMLDILLLDLSDGKMGLREVLLKLVSKYGKGKPFSEANFYDDLANMTFEEVKDFTTKYIVNNENMPYEEFFNKIGLKYSHPSARDLVIEKMETLTPRQQMLFDAWSKNN